MILLFLVHLLLSSSLAQSPCEDQLIEDQTEDTRIHECRACHQIQVDAAANCPSMGYDCDESLTLKSNVLFADDCGCSHLRCWDANATLAVAGEPVHELRCKDRAWHSTNGDTESAVCGRKCGLRVCSNVDESVQGVTEELDVKPPDADHKCAWGVCEIGAVVNDGKNEHVYKGRTSFTCSGDQRWIRDGGEKLTRVACVSKDCTQLPFEAGAYCENQWHCYAPTAIDGEGEIWKLMTCPDAAALKLTQTGLDISAMCTAGQWSTGIAQLEDTAKVTCITCHNVDTESSDPFQPTISERNKGVTCEIGKKLFIELLHGGVTSYVEVTTLTCDAGFFWQTTDGDFSPLPSLRAAEMQGATWKARCVEPKTCDVSFTSTPWDGTACHTKMSAGEGGRVDCVIPKTGDAEQLTCYPGEQPVIFSSTSDAYRLLKSVKCDKVTGKWIFESPAGSKQDQDVFTTGFLPQYYVACWIRRE